GLRGAQGAVGRRNRMGGRVPTGGSRWRAVHRRASLTAPRDLGSPGNARPSWGGGEPLRRALAHTHVAVLGARDSDRRSQGRGERNGDHLEEQAPANGRWEPGTI